MMPVCNAGRGGTATELATAVADEAYFLYERALQKEEEPELTITLPPAAGSAQLPDAAANGDGGSGDRRDGPARTAFAALASGGPLASDANGREDAAAAALMPPPPTPGAGGQAAAAGVGSASGSRTVTVRIEYDVREPAGGMRFHGGYACSDNQARALRSGSVSVNDVCYTIRAYRIPPLQPSAWNWLQMSSVTAASSDCTCCQGLQAMTTDGHKSPRPHGDWPVLHSSRTPLGIKSIHGCSAGAPGTGMVPVRRPADRRLSHRRGDHRRG